MKKLLLAGTALGGLALAGPALAADLPVKAPPIMVAPAFSWTGCYIGGHVGGARGQKEWSGFTNEFGNLFGGGLVSLFQSTVIAVASGSSSVLVLTEVSFSGTSIAATRTLTTTISGLTTTITFTNSARTNVVTSTSDDTAGFLGGGQI